MQLRWKKENTRWYGWKQRDGEEMPEGDLQSGMNDAYLAGVPFRWDSGGICFSLVFGLSTFQPLRLSPGRSHLWRFVHVGERAGEGEMSVSKIKTHQRLECLMSWLHIGSRRHFP